jgi:hypothetical protein
MAGVGVLAADVAAAMDALRGRRPWIEGAVRRFSMRPV